MRTAKHGKREGEWIGDDGKTMTVARKWCHQLLNTYFIYGLIIIGVGAVVGGSTFFMGQTITDAFEMRWVGGEQFHGFDLALLLRLESLFILISGTIFLATSFLGFSWLYDGKSFGTTKHWTLSVIGISVFWIVIAFTSVQVIDPIAIINIIIAVLFLRSANTVDLDIYMGKVK